MLGAGPADPTPLGQQLRFKAIRPAPRGSHGWCGSHHDCLPALVLCVSTSHHPSVPPQVPPSTNLCHVSDWGRYLNKLANYSNRTVSFISAAPDYQGLGSGQETVGSLRLLPPRIRGGD